MSQLTSHFHRTSTRHKDTTSNTTSSRLAASIATTTQLMMTALLTFLFMGDLLNNSTSPNTAQAMNFLPLTTSISQYFHKATKERVSCNKWLQRHKQNTNIFYLFATAASLENQAAHLKTRYLAERVGDVEVERKWEMMDTRDFLLNRHHHRTNNFSTDLHHLIADMRLMDEDLDSFYIPRLKKAEVGEEDTSRERSFEEVYKSLIYHSFELRCKLNYWINRKTEWLKKHYNNNNSHNITPADDDEDVAVGDGYYDLLVTLERESGRYRDVDAKEDGRQLRDFILVHSLLKQLNWFINQAYLTQLVDHLHPKREERGFKRDQNGGLSKRRLSGSHDRLSIPRNNHGGIYRTKRKFRFRRL